MKEFDTWESNCDYCIRLEERLTSILQWNSKAEFEIDFEVPELNCIKQSGNAIPNDLKTCATC